MTTQISNATLDAVQAIEQAPSILKIKEAFRNKAECCGFTAFLCAASPVYGKTSDPILFAEWPEKWSRRYFEKRHHVHDPMFLEAHHTADPFLWSEKMASLSCSKPQQTVMDEAAEAKMIEGFVVPIYGVGGTMHVLTMAGEAPRTDRTTRAELHLLSIYAYGRAKNLRRKPDGPTISLSKRERDALYWASLGKTDWEIGEILFISESAAHKLIESAKRKCNVPTRIQAVVVAIRQGDIPV
jgi:LuxR family quorum sensing-dependent transcriptional regulator